MYNEDYLVLVGSVGREDGGVLPLLERGLQAGGARAGLRAALHEQPLQPHHRLQPHAPRQRREVRQELPQR